MLKAIGIIALFIFSVSGRQGFGPGEQEWGYETVRDGAHIFWWLYYTTADVSSYTERPLIIWLQGGPGASSTGYGNFAELGPLDLDLNERNHTWVKNANVLFIDNPVGSGFSYADYVPALTRDNKQIAEDLVQTMRGFYEKLPQFKTVPLAITSESYGGKMAAEFAYELDKASKEGSIEANLVSVGLGDAWVSPIDSVLTWAPYLFHVGAVDQEGYDRVTASAKLTQDALDAGNYEEATSLWSATEYVIMSVAHNIDFYNILKEIPSRSTQKHITKLFQPATRDEEDDKLEDIMNGQVREALGLNRTWGAQRSAVFSNLRGDFMKPVTEIVELLLNTTNVPVFVYNGQLDLIVDTPGIVYWIDSLNWSRKNEWVGASRNAIVYDRINEGYVKNVGNLYMYWINRAGHMVPADNPRGMDIILREMTNNYAGAPTSN